MRVIEGERYDLREVIVVEVDGRQLGLPVDLVDEIQPAAQLTRLPDAPPVVEGVLDLRGDLIPVLDARRRLGLEVRPMQLSDRLVITRVDERRIALRVDAATVLVKVRAADVSHAAALAPDALRHAGLARMLDGTMVVTEPELFLSADEAKDLHEALRQLKR